MSFVKALSLATVACVLVPFAASAQKLPPDIAASKVVRRALNTGYAPLETRDPTTNEPVGFDIDLAAAMAKVLGVKIEYQDGSFEQMHAGEALLFLYTRIWPSLGGGSVSSGC